MQGLISVKVSELYTILMFNFNKEPEMRWNCTSPEVLENARLFLPFHAI